ncbi:regulator of cell wall mannosyl phosphorylation [Spathaspora passalidarum NRRL Y-27907]|uniref:Regulator of cell wall mannosyl phosphorylation n=1 Tax=Spathaspora passalidarum (strain NRRL Y-27907 / 11-Y1) TaxID=619300 RepID=G3ALI2_SPAPN|nr:regulator of cell wall mannosyl phosphorylation [Spathaspora passalidarum NRRL Y-27907]EGW33225.1 regulator of cell wall mannosyl phosphorylation [Spathaspora passalidarum NRRL Y-27907]
MVKLLNRKFLLKLSILILLTYTISISIQSLTSKPSMIEYRNSINRQIKYKFKSWYFNILCSNLNLDNNKKFIKELAAIKEEKLQNDYADELWDINDNLLAKLPLSVTIPKYYYKGEGRQKKPKKQPFDPRFTLAVYFKYLELQGTDSAVPFHWSDWVDLSRLDKYILPDIQDNLCAKLFDISKKKSIIENSNIVDINQYCKYLPKTNLGYKITQFTGAQTVDNRELLGKSYLYTTAPSPRKLVFLTTQGSYQVSVKHYKKNNVTHSILENNMVPKVIKANPSVKKLNVVDTYKSMLDKHGDPKSTRILQDPTIHIPENSFNVNPFDIINELQNAPYLTKMDKHYLDSIKYSVTCMDPPKYFDEAKLLEKHSEPWLGSHYDWRFFNGLTIGKDQQLIVLHRLLKNYLNFTRIHGIITWIAHGSLLSWYWNGVSFPYDTDIDVQVPISELHKLARYFNQSMVVENIVDSEGKFDGMGRYFIDVGSTITHRKKGNGQNNIDARFIDVDTGLYIDITALALTDTPAPSRYDNYIAMDRQKSAIVKHFSKPGQLNHQVKNEQLKVYNCRNEHFSMYEELSPLILTVVENQLSYIPSNFFMTLNNEYQINGLTEKNYRDYIYLNNFRMWLKTQTILDYINSPQLWIDEHNSTLNNQESLISRSPSSGLTKRVVGNIELLQLNKLTVEDHINLLQSNQIFKEFHKTMNFTKFHEMELQLILKNQFEDAIELLKQYQANNNLGKALRPDLFMDSLFVDTKNRDFINRVNNVLEVQSMYEDKL